LPTQPTAASDQTPKKVNAFHHGTINPKLRRAEVQTNEEIN
jgi:hypothetical protein